MPPKRTVFTAIQQAEKILPGAAAPEEEYDPRWQAIIVVGQFIHSNPEEVWSFIVKWGKSRNADLRMAISTCLLEHLLDEHFDAYFPRIEALARKSRLFADTFFSCWKLGQAEEPENAKRFDKLKQSLRRYGKPSK